MSCRLRRCVNYKRSCSDIFEVRYDGLSKTLSYGGNASQEIITVNSFSAFRGKGSTLVISAVCIAGLLCGRSVAQQSESPFATETTIPSADSARSVPDMLTQVENAFLKPITFEEYPFRTNLEQNFNATAILGPNDSTPYFAVRTIINAYRAAGFPGEYAVTQTGDRVDVFPSHGSAASAANWKPLMSYPVSFQLGTRTIEETLELLCNQIAAESGYSVLLLGFPGFPFNAVELSAKDRPARDVISDIGEKMNWHLSFQALYQPDSKLYYLNVVSVAAPNVAGGPPRSGRIKEMPKAGRSNSSFFAKETP